MRIVKAVKSEYDSGEHQMSKYMIARKYMNEIRCFPVLTNLAFSFNFIWIKRFTGLPLPT
jgi:hypothetical protein